MDKDLVRKLDFLYELGAVFWKYGYESAKGGVTLHPDDIPEIDIGANYVSFTEEGRFYIVDRDNTRWVYKELDEYREKIKELGF